MTLKEHHAIWAEEKRSEMAKVEQEIESELELLQKHFIEIMVRINKEVLKEINEAMRG